MAMSYRTVQGIVTKLGEHHDAKVLEWCEKLKSAKLCDVSKLIMLTKTMIKIIYSTYAGTYKQY